MEDEGAIPSGFMAGRCRGNSAERQNKVEAYDLWPCPRDTSPEDSTVYQVARLLDYAICAKSATPSILLFWSQECAWVRFAICLLLLATSGDVRSIKTLKIRGYMYGAINTYSDFFSRPLSTRWAMLPAVVKLVASLTDDMITIHECIP